MTLHSEETQIQYSAASSVNLGASTEPKRRDEDIHSGKSSEGEDTSEPHQYPPTWRLSIIMLGLSFAVFCMALDFTIMATAIPKITAQFHSLQDMSWYASAYLLTTCSLTIVFGKLYTIFPIKWVYIIALAVFEVGSLICGLAPNSLGLIFGRAIAGLGSAGTFSGAVTIISLNMPLQERPLYTSLITGIFGISSVAGPLMGGAFTEYLTWRWCFYINLPIAGVAALIIFAFLDGRKPIEETIGAKDLISQLDLVGLLFFCLAIICLLLVLALGGTKYSWGDRRVIGLIVAFVGLLSIFVVMQWWQQEKATIPPQLAKKRDIWGSSIFIFCISGAMMVPTYYLPIWFQSIKGESAAISGLMNLPLILSMTLCSFFSAFLVSKIGYYTPFMYFAPVLSAIGAGLLSTLKVESGPAQWIGYQVIFGIGIGLGLSQPLVAVQAVLTPEIVPHAIAIVIFMDSIGGSIAISMAENVFRSYLIKGLAQEAPTVDAHEIIETGITMLRDTVSPDELGGVLRAYNSAVTRAMYVGVVLSALATIGAVPIRWISVKENKTEEGPV